MMLALQLLPLAICGALGLRMLAQVNRLWDFIVDDTVQLGPRMRWPILRAGLRATGHWMMSLSACLAIMSFTKGPGVELATGIAPAAVGAAMAFAPGFFSGDVEWFMPTKHDHQEPIGPRPDPRPVYGPEPDPEPWLRDPDWLEEWLDE